MMPRSSTSLSVARPKERSLREEKSSARRKTYEGAVDAHADGFHRAAQLLFGHAGITEKS